MSRAYFFVIICALLFGSMEVACKIGGNELDPFQLTFLRFVIGALILLPFAVKDLKKRNIRLTGKDLLILAGVGTLGIPISMVMFQLSVMTSNASTVAVLFCTNPFFTMLFAHWFTEEKLNRHKMTVMAIALAGIFFLVRPWDIQAENSLQGMGMMLLAAFIFGAYTVFGSVIVRKIGLMAQTSISFLMGAAILLIMILVMGRPVLAGAGGSLPILFYTGVCVTGIGYFSYFKSIELADASTGAFAFFLKPVVALILSVLLLRERILWNTIIGIILILIASLRNIMYQKERSAQARAEAKRKSLQAEKGNEDQ